MMGDSLPPIDSISTAGSDYGWSVMLLLLVLLAGLVALRRDLHAHPELRFEEHRTSALVAERLGALGVAVHRGLGGTGVVGTIPGDGPGAILLRADMDALPIVEASGVAHASRHAGVIRCEPGT